MRAGQASPHRSARLFALGREAEVGFGLQPDSFGERLEEYLPIADGDWLDIGESVARFAAVQRVPDGSGRGNEQLDLARAVVEEQPIAQRERVLPRNRRPRLVLAGGVNREEADPQRRSFVRGVCKPRALDRGRAPFRVVDARERGRRSAR